MALLAALVIFTVIARYCFSLSWKQLAEFNTTLFAFTTFWGMGINVIKDEHVMIDILYDGVKPARKRWLAIVNYLIVLAVVLVFTYQGFKYFGTPLFIKSWYCVMFRSERSSASRLLTASFSCIRITTNPCHCTNYYMAVRWKFSPCTCTN